MDCALRGRDREMAEIKPKALLFRVYAHIYTHMSTVHNATMNKYKIER